MGYITIIMIIIMGYITIVINYYYYPLLIPII